MDIRDLRAVVDVVIICVREEDELPELLKRFGGDETAVGGQPYHISKVPRRDGSEAWVAIVQSGEGPSAAQQTMNNIVSDLRPFFTLIVGVAGGVPQEENGHHDIQCRIRLGINQLAKILARSVEARFSGVLGTKNILF